MTAARDACPGCSREFAPRGLSNHLRLSHDPRCTSAWNSLRSTYPVTLQQEAPHPPQPTDVEMIDLSDIESVTPFQQSSQTDAVNMDIDISYSGDSTYPQSTLGEAPNLITPPSNALASVIFDSDVEDSDDDGDHDQTPPSARSTTDTRTEQVSQTGKSVYTYRVSISD